MRCGAPSAITRLQILLRSSTPARVLPREQPRSETFKPNTVIAARLMRAILYSRLITIIGTSTASSTPISLAVIPPKVVESPDTVPATESSLSLAMKYLYRSFNHSHDTACGSVAAHHRLQVEESDATPKAAPESAACETNRGSATKAGSQGHGTRPGPRRPEVLRTRLAQAESNLRRE